VLWRRGSAPGHHHHPRAEGPDEARIGLDEREQVGEVRVEPAIIRVEEGDPGTAGGADAGVASRARALVGLAQELDRRAVAREDLAGLVGRAVVYDDHLRGRAALREDAVHRLAHLAGAVVGADHRGHLRVALHRVFQAPPQEAARP
jgi:hypothetical protein